VERPRLLLTIRNYWSERARRSGRFGATRDLLLLLWEFLSESRPSRLKTRFGDADYDWDFRVNTTSGAVGWRDRLLGAFHSPYQPTDPILFREMLDAVCEHAHQDLAQFTFIDLGSGKGRALLLASDYPFRRIIGVELLPSLNAIAQQNLTAYKSDSQQCFALESTCADATTYRFPDGPLLIYLFNPFPESGLRRTIENLRQSLHENPRPAYVLYHNPQLEPAITETGCFRKITGTHQYSIFSAT
jgi:SAM-dependent methyltransferase